MKTISTLLATLAASLPALAQDDDVYKTLALGDRVQVTFRSGCSISGQLVINPIGRTVRPPKAGETTEEKMDYAKENSLTVDLSWEYPGLNGTMTITKKEIREVKKLQHLDAETRKRLSEQKAEIQKDLARQNAAIKASSDKGAKEADAARAKMEADAKKEQDKVLEEAKEAAKQKKLEILKQYPPDGGWGPDKLKEISGKAQRKQPLTEQEMNFMQNFGAWAEAKSIQDEMLKGAEKKEAPPEVKK